MIEQYQIFFTNISSGIFGSLWERKRKNENVSFDLKVKLFFTEIERTTLVHRRREQILKPHNLKKNPVAKLHSASVFSFYRMWRNFLSLMFDEYANF